MTESEVIKEASAADGREQSTVLVRGDWYWVSHDGATWWPAKHDPSRVGGWSNDDTWEDFEREVKHWHRLGRGPEG